MPRPDAPRDLLLALLALQNGLVTRDQLVSAFGAWTGAPAESLADLLVRQGALDAVARELLEGLTERFLARHDGDAEKGLTELSVSPSTVDHLRTAAGPEFERTLTLLHPGRDARPSDAALTFTLGGSTSDGQRFRVLRPHAKGGLGAVYVALDTELHREVALKQIQETFADEPTSRRRFVVEAEVTGGLEHPGIVPVYGLGTYGDGRPYYAMRFVRGDNLKEVAGRFHADDSLRRDPGRRTLELHKLLRRFLDVCNAIEYAHSRGVLHRDIKPGNVIVGRHGETLVVDWGLARPLGRREPGGDGVEPTLVPASNGGSSETLPGAAMGTPAYMSPEQASGDLDALSGRSDVYSLGATLYHLLTGKPPFTGPDVLALLRAVKAGEFPRPRVHDVSIDPALEAVCLKAMALAPDDRYPSPRGLADDLERWLADGPVTAYREPWTRTLARWLSRHRTAVTGAAAAGVVALAGLGVVAAVQAKARRDLDRKNNDLTAANAALEVQRRRAVDREKDALAAVKRFGEAVSRNPELKNRPELKPLRTELLKEPLTFFRSLRDRLLADRETSPEALVTLAAACFDLGYLTEQIGEKRDAVTAYRDSLAVYQQYADSQPGDAEAQRSLSACHNNIGTLLLSTGQTAEALASYGRALAISETLAETHPDDPRFRLDLAGGLHNLGNVLAGTGRPAEALRPYERALDLQRKLIEAEPSNAEFQRNHAVTHDALGKLQSETGRMPDALNSYQRALAVRQKLADDHPDDPQFQADLASGCYNLGNLLKDGGRLGDALRQHERALAVRQKLVEAHPSDTRFRRDLAQSHQNLGSVLNAAGRREEALRSFRRALEIKQELAEADPADTGYQGDMANSHNAIGNALSDAGRRGEALESYGKALAIWQKLADAHPEVTLFQSGQADGHYNIGVLLREWGRPAEAMASHRRSLAVFQKLADANPQVTEFRSSLGRAHFSVGNLLADSGRVPDALESYGRAVSTFQTLADANPGVPGFRRQLATAYLNIGNLLSVARREAEALASFEKARAVQQKLAEEYPDSAQDARELASTLNNLAALDMIGGRFAAARDRLRQAVAWQKKAVAADPEHPEFRRLLAGLYGNVLVAARNLGDPALAAEASRGLAELDASDPRLKALDARLVEVLAGAEPRGTEERLDLARRAYDTRRYAAAARFAGEALAADPGLAADRVNQHPYNAACSAALAAAGRGDDSPAEPAARARLRGRALQWLRGELAAWDAVVRRGTPDERARAAGQLGHWLVDADLAGVRDAEALATPDGAERAAWRTLWDEVGRLIERASVARPGSEGAWPDLPADVFVP